MDVRQWWLSGIVCTSGRIICFTQLSLNDQTAEHRFAVACLLVLGKSVAFMLALFFFAILASTFARVARPLEPPKIASPPLLRSSEVRLCTNKNELGDEIKSRHLSNSNRTYSVVRLHARSFGIHA